MIPFAGDKLPEVEEEDIRHYFSTYSIISTKLEKCSTYSIISTKLEKCPQDFDGDQFPGVVSRKLRAQERDRYGRVTNKPEKKPHPLLKALLKEL